jgi:hypothetical protein
MKKQTISLILLLTCQVFAANKPTFINMQTADGIIHYPIIVGVTETDVIIDGQVAIPISSINSVMAYGESKSIIPLLWGAGCCYLGQIPGCVLGVMIFPKFAAGDERDNAGFLVSMGMGAILSGMYGYKRSAKNILEQNQQMVFMAPWTFGQKRDFFISALKP